jgi:hypothetical protein
MAQKTTPPERSMFARRRWHFPSQLTRNPDHPNLPELYDVRVNLAVSPAVLLPPGAQGHQGDILEAYSSAVADLRGG